MRPQIVRLDRELDAERKRPREPKVVEKIVQVPVEKEKIVQVPVEKEKVVQVPVEKVVEVQVPVDRLVEVPIEKVVFVDKPEPPHHYQSLPRASTQLGPNVGVGLSLQRSSRVRGPNPNFLQSRSRSA